MKYLFYILSSFVFISLFFGCVTEDDVFNDDLSQTTDVIETSLIVSFLNENYTKENEEPINCFSFIYPLDISYNTNQIVTVINEQGLNEIIKSQSSNFHINGLMYPITVLIDNTEVIFENTTDFNTLYETCNTVSLNTTLVDNIGNCFDFQYPITLLDTLQDEAIINTEIDFIGFLDKQGPDYITTFKFPFFINETLINNYYDIYQITNNCFHNPCPEIRYSIPSISNNGLNYDFVASGYSGDIKYIWSINNEYIQDGVFDGNNDEYFSYDFTQNGTYSVCIFIETPECPQGIEYCEEIIINNIDTCPEITFEALIQNNGYRFEALGHTSSVTANYVWSINGEQINDNVFDGNNNEYFSYDFPENGTYTVCTIIETSDCPQGVEYCEDIIVTNVDSAFNITVSEPVQDTMGCFDLSYNYTISNGNSNLYLLEANIDDNYSWHISSEENPTEEYIGSGGTLEYEFTEIGEYTICASLETPDCPNGERYCKSFKVE